MKTIELNQNLNRVVALVAQVLILGLGASAMASTTLSSVAVGIQSPDPVCAGTNATYAVTVTRTGNGNMDVYLSASGLPAGAQATFSPNPVVFGGSTSTGTATMVVSTASTTPPGSNPFTLAARDGSSPNFVTTPATLDVTLRCQGVARMASGFMFVALNAPTNAACCIQATTNLVNPIWTTLCVTNSGTNSLLTFADRDSSKYPCRFYRLSVP